MEAIATMALLNKSVDYAKRLKPLGIVSVTQADNNEGYVFVEAHKSESVSEAIAGLNFCYGKITMLSLNEMPKLYEQFVEGGYESCVPREG